MIKNKKRSCDICGGDMPMLIDFDDPEIIPFDIIALGHKTKSGKVINKYYDACQDCMENINELLPGR